MYLQYIVDSIGTGALYALMTLGLALVGSKPSSGAASGGSVLDQPAPAASAASGTSAPAGVSPGAIPAPVAAPQPAAPASK